ncbi:MAG: hypothetical protein ABIH11_08905 [Candidatus Altiarchaeota archaeon]
MNARRLFVFGLAGLLLVGMVASANAFFGSQSQGKRGMFRNQLSEKYGLPENGEGCDFKTTVMEDLGLGEDATQEEVREALFARRLDQLGLTEDSTIRELRDALDAEREERLQEKMSALREKCGLPEDASEDEVKECMKERVRRGPGFRGGKAGFMGNGLGII